MSIPSWFSTSYSNWNTFVQTYIAIFWRAVYVHQCLKERVSNIYMEENLSSRFHLAYIFGHKITYTHEPVHRLVMTKRIKSLHVQRHELLVQQTQLLNHNLSVLVHPDSVLLRRSFSKGDNSWNANQDLLTSFS